MEAEESFYDEWVLEGSDGQLIQGPTYLSNLLNQIGTWEGTNTAYEHPPAPDAAKKGYILRRVKIKITRTVIEN